MVSSFSKGSSHRLVRGRVSGVFNKSARGIGALALLSMGACSSGAPPAGGGEIGAARSPLINAAEQPVDVVFRMELANGEPVAADATPLPPGAYTVELGQDPAKPPGPPSLPEPPSKIHPELLSALAARRDAACPEQEEEDVDVIVTFADDMQIPRFPEPNEGEPPDSDTNSAALTYAAQLEQDIAAARAPAYAQLAQELENDHGAQALEDFWLVNAMRVSMPLSEVNALAARGDVQYIEPSQTTSPPPVNRILDARNLLRTDPYFGFTGGWIGLLDTGVRRSHTLLSNISFLRDCVNGGANCNTPGTGFNTDDNCWNHGTSTASIVSGNNNLGNDNRGITPITIDSFKIYSCAGLDTAAAIRGFQQSVAVLDRVIVAEIQGGGNENSALSAAADAAYNAGAVVVSANGNFGPGVGSVRAPGNARKVLGIGAVDVNNQALQGYSGRGPTGDNRIKPDLVGFTNIFAASNTGDNALQLFTGTSCATPTAAGATALVRNRLRGTDFNIDAGQVYAFMIMAGRNFGFNNNTGAGQISLPLSGFSYWGSVNVGAGSTVNIPFSLGGGAATNVNAAIWWPESSTQTHNDVDLYLINPVGTTASLSLSIGSIFEKVRTAGGFVAGTWTLRIRSFNVTGTQRVYYALNVGGL